MKIPVLNKSVWLGLVAIAIVGGAAAGVMLNGNFNQPQIQSSPQVSVPTSSQQIGQSSAPTRAKDGELAVYWIESNKNRLLAVPIAIKAKSNNEAIATAMNTLIAENPPDANLYSAIPTNTKVLNLTTKINAKSKEIEINLSKDFTKGGGSASMQGRIIQVLYTVTSLDPEAKVYLSVEGKALKYIGGEGLEVPQPMTRKDFALEF